MVAFCALEEFLIIKSAVINIGGKLCSYILDKKIVKSIPYFIIDYHQ